MDFRPTSDQESMVDSARRMMANDIEPILRRHPADQPLPKESAKQILQHLAKLGLTAARLPEEAGGPGMTMVDYGLIMEQLTPTIMFMLMPQEVTAARVHASCTDEQRERFLPALISAERIACTATTEPDAGSDAKGVRLRLREDGDHLVLDGTKMWVSSATISDIYNVTCRAASGEIVRVLVDRAESQVRTREIPVTGLQQCHLGEIAFEGTRVPRRNMLGGAGETSRILTLTWLGNRPLIGLGAVHLAQKAFEASVEYAKLRSQFGRKIGGFQLVQERLADIETAIVTSRLLCYHALQSVDRGERANGLSAMAKRYAVDACGRAIGLAMQLHGSMGLSQELGLERMARDLRMLTIPDGTPEILTLIQGRELTSIDAIRG
jgi:alkylation response protein AidB-like acyl-CoA dehydrogenase